MPSIIWETQVGSLQWRNNIIVEDGRVYVGSCGYQWNKPDIGDGVCCIDAGSGQPIWFAPTFSDVNEIALIEGRIVTGTDNGRLFVISSTSGAVEQFWDLGSACYARAVALGNRENPGALVSTSDGSYYFLILGKSLALRKIGSIPFRVRANPVLESDEPGAWKVIQAAESGEIIRLFIDRDSIRSELVSRITFANKLSDTGESLGGVFATPFVKNGKLFVGYVRQTYYNFPPLVCIDLRSGSTIWHASAQDFPELKFGNCRTTPCIVGDELLMSFPYSDSLFGISACDGRVSWHVKVGESIFQQWASTVPGLGNSALLARANGVLSKISLTTHNLEWSVSLEVVRGKKTFTIRDGGRSGPYIDDKLLPGDSPIGGICATPATQGEHIFCGTTDGRLFCVVDS